MPFTRSELMGLIMARTFGLLIFTVSIVEFFDFDDLKQEAIPTSNRKAEAGDVLVLNYMYNSSLLKIFVIANITT